jgi:hypothetical protein
MQKNLEITQKSIKRSFLRLNLIIASIVVVILLGNSVLNACTIYFTNDSDTDMELVLYEIGQKMTVKAGAQVMFGEEGRHACFDLFKGHKRLYRVIQRACTPEKEIHIHARDLPYQFDNEVFEVLD